MILNISGNRVVFKMISIVNKDDCLGLAQYTFFRAHRNVNTDSVHTPKNWFSVHTLKLAKYTLLKLDRYILLKTDTILTP